MPTEPNLSQPGSRRTASARNCYLLGDTLAILLCPGPNGCTVGVTIDRDDLQRVLARGFWRVSVFPGGLYCYTNTNHKGNLYLHRFIHGAVKGEYIDHIWHRTLDNRKSETRKCTQGLNQLNRVYGGHGLSGLRGVFWKRGKWETKVNLDNKRYYLGRYMDREIAAEVVRQFLAAHGAEYAVALKTIGRSA